MQTSKKIILASYVIGIALTAVTVVGAFLGKDVTTIGIVTSAAYAEIAASNAFYFNKAKKENALKITVSCVQKNSDKMDEIVKLLSAIGGLV